MSPWANVENVDRRSNLSLEEFITQYGTPNIPVIITDIVPKYAHIFVSVYVKLACKENVEP